MISQLKKVKTVKDILDKEAFAIDTPIIGTSISASLYYNFYKWKSKNR